MRFCVFFNCQYNVDFDAIFRNLAVGACSTNARLGTIAAPYIVMLVRNATQFSVRNEKLS